jgi:CTP synthase (UTP-ammonia lyase)
LKIALVGDYNAEVVAHRAIPMALSLAGAEGVWVHTTAAGDLSAFAGIWCVPASPYASAAGAFAAIRLARETGRPFLGTCGGFQHAVIEYARNVRGMTGADHAETNPDAAVRLIAPLACSLVEASEELTLEPGTRLVAAYGVPRVHEGYHCRYGLNPALATELWDGDLRPAAHDDHGEVRAAELDSHPFFVLTLFQPERRALRGEVPPPVREFVSAARNYWAAAASK